MKKYLLAAAALLAGAALSWGQGAEALSPDQAVARALKVNTTYQTALLAVDQAAAARVDWLHWKGIAVSATEKATGSGTDAASAKTTTTLGLTLPLLDQLTASATVDQDQTLGASVTVTPLAHSAAAAQAEVAWEKAVLAAAQARTTLETAVRKAWLAQASAEANLAAQVKLTALRETAYTDSKAQYDKGVVTLAEVRTALKAWTDARTTQSTLEQTLIQARADLASRLQTDAVTLTALTTADLQALVEGLGQAEDSGAVPTAVKLQALEVANQMAKADNTWWVDPNLQITGSGSQTTAGTVTWSGQVTLSFALGNVGVADRLLADRSVALAQQALAAQTTASKASVAQARLATAAADDTVESRQLALTQAEELLKQTQLLAKAGKVTALDLDDASLGVETARNDLFAAWASAYGARLDLAAALR